MKLNSRTIAVCVMMLLKAAAVVASDEQIKPAYEVILLDVTGSMQMERDDGDTRCEFAKTTVRRQLMHLVNNNNVTHIDIRTFGEAHTTQSVIGGFQPLPRPGTAALRSFTRDLKSTLSDINCAGSTAIGDAVCLSVDDLRSEAVDANAYRITILTDAGENDSKYCGGYNYIDRWLEPKLLAEPNVRLDVTILKSEQSLLPPVKRERHAASISNEITQWMALSHATGGIAVIAHDNGECSGDCDEIGPW